MPLFQGIADKLSETLFCDDSEDSEKNLITLPQSGKETRIFQVRRHPLAFPDIPDVWQLFLMIDVTETRRTEEKLRLYQRAVEQSPATVVITSPGGSIEYVNPKFTQLTGYSLQEALGKNPRILKSGEQSPEFYRDMWETLSGGREWRGEFHNRKKNGELYWEFASISPMLNEKGETTHYLAVKEDVTARRNAEEALRLSEQKLRVRNLQMERDLKLAQSVQKALISQGVPPNDMLEVKTVYKPLEKVGGDYLSLYKNENGLGVFLGDVSGHGIASALFIALLKSVTDRMFRDYGSDPSAFVTHLNLELIDQMSSYFITAIYGYFQRDVKTGQILFSHSNGGHPQPLLLRKDGASEFLGNSNTVIGVAEKTRWDLYSTPLAAGDRLFLYTDGIPETENAEKRMVGFDEYLLPLFNRARREGLADSLSAVIQGLDEFRAEAAATDDITLIGFEVL